METDRVDQIIQYSLLVAGEQDDFMERSLGPIHLLKYVYLADLEYAARNDGETYSGARWVFYNFGPWSPEVHDRIEPALAAIHANRKAIESNYSDDDFIRWDKRDDHLYREKEHGLPIVVVNAVRSSVRKFGSSTPDLLHYVYSTRPMLSAAPNEELQFIGGHQKEKADPIPTRMESASNRKQKKFREGMQALRAERAARKQREKLVNPVTKYRDDGVFEEGVDWLDGLAGDRPPEGPARAKFTDEVWHSDARKDIDVP